MTVINTMINSIQLVEFHKRYLSSLASITYISAVYANTAFL